MRIAVVGLGHIGLPLAVQYASRGHDVLGVDVAQHIVDAINRGESPHLDEQTLIDRVPELHAAGLLRATTWADASGLGEVDVIVVIVPVVVDADRQIDFGPIDAATRDIAGGIGPDTLVVYETTLPVGTTRDRFGPMLEKGSGLHLDRDLFLAFSPERVLVGRIFLDLRRYPKIVGGTSDESTRRAAEFYRSVLDDGTEVVAVANAETAEMTKLAETTYRDVNI
ncbi:MAG: NAD(P)-binding domain-containing protein, partial [Chloroflexota bacterium]